MKGKGVVKYQIQRIHALLAKKYPAILADKDLKANFVFTYTDDKERVSTKQMTFGEANKAIEFLKDGSSSKSSTYGDYARFDMKNRTHRFLLAICISVGWSVYHEKLNREVADLERFGAWIAKSSPYKKPLKKHNAAELKKLVAQFSRVVEYTEQKQEANELN